jgi:hypothetical protein
MTSQEENTTWRDAKKYANRLGLVPSSFSTAIRILLTDQRQKNSELRAVTKYQIARLMRGPSFKAMLYFGTKSLRGKYIVDQKVVTVGDMLDMFEPFDIAAMIGCYLVVRKWRKGLSPDDWQLLLESMELESQVSAHVGAMIGKVGVGACLLVGTLPYLALGCALFEAPKEARKYIKSALKDQRMLWDPKAELEFFKTDLSQLGTLLLLGLGFGKDLCEGYVYAQDAQRPVRAEKEIDPLSYRMKMARLWTDAIMQNKEQPSIAIPGAYYPLAGDRSYAMEQIAAVREGGETHWLTRGKSDISAELTPQLFGKIEASDEVPEELADIFNMKSIGKMDMEEFDDLCDQMDYEAAGKVKPGAVSLSSKELKDLEQMVE